MLWNKLRKSSTYPCCEVKVPSSSSEHSIQNLLEILLRSVFESLNDQSFHTASKLIAHPLIKLKHSRQQKALGWLQASATNSSIGEGLFEAEPHLSKLTSQLLFNEFDESTRCCLYRSKLCHLSDFLTSEVTTHRT